MLRREKLWTILVIGALVLVGAGANLADRKSVV